MSLDIRPGELSNPLSLSGQGLLPVALLSNPSFSAATVDASTVTLGDPRLPQTVAPTRDALQDVDGDGRLDRIFFFSLPDLVGRAGVDTSSARLVLRGRTDVGGTIVADDTVSVVP